jgi:hypothetical protein
VRRLHITLAPRFACSYWRRSPRRDITPPGVRRRCFQKGMIRRRFARSLALVGVSSKIRLWGVDHYLSGPVTSQPIIANAATARDAARGLLLAASTGFTGADTPKGCLLASSAISCSRAAAEVQEELAVRRRAIESLLAPRIVQAIHVGELPATLDAEALAAHTMAVIRGMSTLARDGAKRGNLLRLVDTAMLAWPVPRTRRVPKGI